MPISRYAGYSPYGETGRALEGISQTISNISGDFLRRKQQERETQERSRRFDVQLAQEQALTDIQLAE